jgi:type IV pilus assembly protein PilA
MSKLRKGFTLIELLVVIGILGILLAIVLIAINPAAQFAQANNTARTNDVNTILNAVHQYAADHKGLLPGGTEIPEEDPLTPASDALEISTAGADICAQIVPDYVSLLPVDPDTNDGIAVGLCVDPLDPTYTYATNYFIVKDANGRVTVSAPESETVRGTKPTIQVTR